MSEEIRILIADDHPIFRRGLRAVIESDSTFKVVADVDNGEAALKQVEELKPDIAILDVDMPGMDGLTVARKIQTKHLPTQLVLLTMYNDEALFNAAIDAGVKCFIVKDDAANDILSCIKALAHGQSFFSSVLSQFLLNRHNEQKSFLEVLTVTERRVLRLVAQGKTSREIAHELFVSPRTIEHHRGHISAKLNLTGKNCLLAFALTHKAKILSKT